MQTPTPTEARSRSDLLTQAYPEGDPGDAQLALLLGDDAPVVSELTGRSIGEDGTPGEEVPDYLKPVAIRAMAMRAERFTVGGSAKKRKSAIGTLSLRSFSAGPYSESYFGPGEAATAKVLDPDPAVHELLWALATEEKRDYWLQLWSGVLQPAAGAVAVDWNAPSRRYARGRNRMLP